MNKNNQRFFELLWAMTDKELRTRYKYTFLGFLWLVIIPLLQMLIIGFVFTFFMKQPVKNYYYYLFVGLLVWNFFATSLTKATPSIVFERTLIKKSKFPRLVIPLSIITSNLINLVLAMLIFFVPVLLLGTLIPASLYLIPVALLLLIIFTTGICLLTSALDVRFRDVNFFVQALLIVWFYATPIVYMLSSVPYKYYWLWRINPMTSIIQLFQYAFLNAPPPGIGMITINASINVVIFTLGVFIFRKESDNFDDWV
jgi:ABC-2 type transport system permease protein